MNGTQQYLGPALFDTERAALGYASHDETGDITTCIVAKKVCGSVCGAFSHIFRITVLTRWQRHIAGEPAASQAVPQ